jgi:hypothetical protein
MMRFILGIFIIVVVLVIAALATGFLNINRIRGAEVPQVTASHNGVTATGGQAPAFDVETGSVRVGSKQTTVTVPTVEVQKPGGNQVATNNAM